MNVSGSWTGAPNRRSKPSVGSNGYPKWDCADSIFMSPATTWREMAPGDTRSGAMKEDICTSFAFRLPLMQSEAEPGLHLAVMVHFVTLKVATLSFLMSSRYSLLQSSRFKLKLPKVSNNENNLERTITSWKKKTIILAIWGMYKPGFHERQAMGLCSSIQLTRSRMMVIQEPRKGSDQSLQREDKT